MAINSDSSGFLIGERRLKEMSEGITQTEDNTKQILKVLTESFQDMQKTLSSGNANTSDLIRRQSRGGRSQDASGMPATARSVRNTVDAAEKAVEVTEQALQAVKRIKKKAIDAEAGIGGSTGRPSGTSSSSERAAQARERDANGRFIGKNGEKKGIFSRIKGMVGLGDVSMGGGDVGGIDPTVDAIKELGQIVSPVKTVFKGMSAKAIGVIKGRIKKKRSDEVLPEDQVKANKETAKADKKQNKLLQSILSVLRSQNGGGLLGGMGGLLGKGGGFLSKLLKGGGKGLLKKIPFLGALIGGGFLAKDWKNLDSGGKCKGIGQIVGTVVGGVLGSFLGPVGVIAGGGLGQLLGGVFGEKVGEWTDSLKKLDFAAIFKDYLKDKLGIGSGSGNQAFIPYANAGQSKVERFKSWASDKLGLGGSTATVGDNIDYSNAPDSTNIGGNIAKDPKARKLGMYNALRKQGFTHEQALAVGGEIGRENGYGNAMFGRHVDPAKDKSGKDIVNGGALSWNNGRYDKFAAFMRERGQMDAKGNIPKTQAGLDAQAAYIKKEFGEKTYADMLKKFNGDPNADPRNYAGEMAKVIGWARGQPSIKGKNGRVPFDSPTHERRVNENIDDIAALSKQQSDNLAKKPVNAAKGKPHESILFKKGQQRPPAVKVPAITPELIKIGSKNQVKAVAATPTDIGIGQTVSDRSLAHIAAGGIGYTQHNV